MPNCIKCGKEENPLYSVQTPTGGGLGQAHCAECAEVCDKCKRTPDFCHCKK